MTESLDRLRALPAVHRLLVHPALRNARAVQGDERVVDAIRATLANWRARLLLGESTPIELSLDRFARDTLEWLKQEGSPHLRPVINATGILLHTGLGRAPLAPTAIEMISATARGYCNLELDLASGERGNRTAAISRQLAKLTGAEACTIVNNNAAATVLVLRALAAGREVIVARGELIEIGGSFRLPEIFEVSGTLLKEVGTTNKVRIADYQRAITGTTAALLKVHPSNYRVVGFTESVSIAELAELAHHRNLLAIDDIGSGALGPDRPPVVQDEPTITGSLEGGADLVLCSGDKLLGGPQSGLILGREPLIRRIESDPLMRAVRVDKLTLAALEATLHAAMLPREIPPTIPLWRFLATPVEELRDRAEQLARDLRQLGFRAEAMASEAFLGGGSWPSQTIPSWALVISPAREGRSGRWLADLATALRLGEPSVVATIRRDAAWFDLRAIEPESDAALLSAIRRTLEERSACEDAFESVS